MTAEQTTKTEKMTGARIFLECLRKEGVDKIFGYPGGSILHIYDELYKCDFIKHYLVRHEQAAVHAAEGYARITGKPGVVDAPLPGIDFGSTGFAVNGKHVTLGAFAAAVGGVYHLKHPLLNQSQGAFGQIPLIGHTRLIAVKQIAFIVVNFFQKLRFHKFAAIGNGSGKTRRLQG